MKPMRPLFILHTSQLRFAAAVLGVAALFAGFHALATPAPLVISCALPTAAGHARTTQSSGTGSTRPMLGDEAMSAVKEKLD
ncbi:hypothetical protein [Rhizobacter sp. OV335]|uniref:hypothetical protein n=1 Tax=Rhizobacter sp. OV335 TaxID=1500264 RepID=UPI000924529D|nr:hypothetical protein [Rhizobacter sp. OV335]SHM43342.1 hypothetical protein SAMN02787076_01319 [Rhizobacter sp. OV335]